VGPLHLTPVLVPKPWGGRRLGGLGRRLPPDATIGESWDVADLSVEDTPVLDPCSRVLDGPSAGQSLAELLEGDATVLLGSVPAMDGRFPLLVKTLDARQHLSVQVHPTEDDVVRDPTAIAKSESWLILAAEPGAVLYLGVRHGVEVDDLRRAAGTPAIVELLREVPARPGNLHHLPAGVIHALGAGVLVLEIQTPSDTTYRLYDWTEEYGRAPRTLHLEEALAVAGAAWEVNTDRARAVHRAAGEVGPLLDTDHYRIVRHRLHPGARLRSVGGQARVVYVVEGRLLGSELARSLGRGGVVLLPACWEGPLMAAIDATVVEIRVGPHLAVSP
jgi:mannose-6-phosphate isomerase